MCWPSAFFWLIYTYVRIVIIKRTNVLSCRSNKNNNRHFLNWSILCVNIYIKSCDLKVKQNIITYLTQMRGQCNLENPSDGRSRHSPPGGQIWPRRDLVTPHRWCHAKVIRRGHPAELRPWYSTSGKIRICVKLEVWLKWV